MPEKNPPGVMLYYELYPAIAVLSDAEKGLLLDAILSYGSKGDLPAFDGGTLAAIWALLQPKIDRDQAQYHKKSESARRAVAAREARRYQSVSADSDRYLSTPIPTSTATSTSASAPAPLYPPCLPQTDS